MTPDLAATNASAAGGWRTEAEAAIVAALQYMRGQDPNGVSGAIRNGDLRSRLKWVLMGCGGPLRSSSSHRTDFRALQARRDAALERPALLRAPKPAAPDPRSIAAAIAAGKFTKVPPGTRKIR